MRHKGPEKIALPLRNLHDLFTTPEVDPATNTASGDATATDTFEDELYEPGIDYLSR
jgi:hypothetical protein